LVKGCLLAPTTETFGDLTKQIETREGWMEKFIGDAVALTNETASACGVARSAEASCRGCP
jgi:hypothetical protein